MSHIKQKDRNELIKRKTTSQSKSQPKPATGGKAATAAGSGRRGRRTARRGGRASNRPKPKTTEELDAEMDDYFDTNENGAAPATGAVNGQAQPAGQQQQQQPAAANGGDDVGMAEISVSFFFCYSSRAQCSLSLCCEYLCESGPKVGGCDANRGSLVNG